MAEAIALSLDSKILSTITFPAITAAYKEGLFIWGAKDELSKLRNTIETLQAVLLDAEKRQQDSNAVKNWIKRFTEVLHNAEKLFDEVAKRGKGKEQTTKENEKVLVSSSKLKPISKYSIAKKVKEIRKKLVEISTDISQFECMIPRNEVSTSGITTREDPECYVNEKLVAIGREDDKQAILKMLFNDSNTDAPCPLVIAIVGIGGMGKTTLAHLIYNDDEVTRNYQNKWFVSIHNTSDERVVLLRILQSILKEEDHSSLSVSGLKTRIRDSVKDKKFFLVLDDVWDDDRGRWQVRMSLLSSCAEGSKIIITTRSSTVARAMSASKEHYLEGLSKEDALCLFKRLAFTPGYENDEERISSAKNILKICWGVPLAIQNVGDLYYERYTISEWKEVERKGLLENIGDDKTMSVIKLSYDHLPQKLKPCFAYCSLFPKNQRLLKHELICFWAAQGYIESNNEEAAFMHLVRRGFLQDVKTDEFGEVSCKMHDIMHDLALYVAGEEISVLTKTTSLNLSSSTLHVSVEDCEWDIEQLKVKQLHSFFIRSISPVCTLTTLDKLCKKFNMLCTLDLKRQGFKETLPTSIGDLTLLRYLDLSFNLFKELPHSISNLVNLLALNLMGCSQLKDLPSNLGNLVELKYLNIDQCGGLNGKLTWILELRRLQYLYLGKFVENKKSGLDALARLHQQFRGDLQVRNDLLIADMDDAFESGWKLPIRVQTLLIKGYMGVRLSDWGIINGTNNYLARLTLIGCRGVKHLPALQCLHNLRLLELKELTELESVESEEVYSTSSSPYLPRLEKLELSWLASLKRWTKTTPTPLTFPLLSELEIYFCPLLELASFPQCQRLRKLTLWDVHNDNLMQCQLSSTLFCTSVFTPLEELLIWGCKWLSSLQHDATKSLRFLSIIGCSGLNKSVQLASADLQNVTIDHCEGLVSLEVATPSLKNLTISSCKEFKNLIVRAPLNALNNLEIIDCPKLDLLKLELDWDSLVNLRTLRLHPMPPTENISLSLRNRQALGTLEITAGSFAQEILRAAEMTAEIRDRSQSGELHKDGEGMLPFWDLLC